MNTNHRSLDEVMLAATLCSQDNGLLCINKCPYGKDRESCRINHNLDVLYYLEKLKDISQKSEKLYVVLYSETQKNNMDIEVFGIFENEKDTAKLVHDLNDTNTIRYWYKEISQLFHISL